MTNIEGGYVLVSVGQFASVCAAKREGEISFLALRVWLAAHEQLAKRCTAKRKRFTVLELSRLVRAKVSSVESALRELSALGLLHWSDGAIKFPRELTSAGEELASEFGTSPQRPVPVPRRVLRALFRHTKPSEVLAAIAHLIRCLFIKGGSISSGGLVKASWVASVFAIAERSVHSARKWLLSLGFLAQEQVHQLVMNRFGGKFLIVIRERVARAKKPRSDSAPPYKNISTFLSTSYNQINNKPASRGPGVPAELLRPPTLRDIQPEDLKKPARLEKLYRQAVQAGWIQHSEANVRNFACAALRATRAGGRVGAIFVGIVKNRLWHHITQEQESRALSVLKRFSERNGRAFADDENRGRRVTGLDAKLVGSTLSNALRVVSPGRLTLAEEAASRQKLSAQVRKEREGRSGRAVSHGTTWCA